MYFEINRSLMVLDEVNESSNGLSSGENASEFYVDTMNLKKKSSLPSHYEVENQGTLPIISPKFQSISVVSFINLPIWFSLFLQLCLVNIRQTHIHIAS